MARNALRLIFLLALASNVCFCQTATVYTIDTVVGGAVYDNLPATATPLSFPGGLWLDRDGALWISDSGNQVVRRLNPVTGLAAVVIGGGTVVEDGIPVAGTSVRLERPSHIAGDAAGNIYFTDTGQNRVRKWTPDGQVSTVVGTGEAGFAGDGGPARLAKLNGPTGLVFDGAGNMYIAETNNCRVRRVNAAGIINSHAGGRCGDSGDGGPALDAALSGGGSQFFGLLQGLAFDSRGNLYVATSNTIRRVDISTGIITTVAGIAGQSNCSELSTGALATSRALCSPSNMVFDQDDNLFFTYNFGLARVAASTRTVTSLHTHFISTGLVRDGGGQLISAGSIGGRLFRTAPAGGATSEIAGTSEPFDGPGRLAVLAAPQGLSSDVAGNIHIAEGRGRRIRRFDPATGRVTTVVGGGSTPLADGVAAAAAQMFNDTGIVHVDAQGNIFFTHGFVVLWRVDARTGLLARVAGNAQATTAGGDGGPALQATFANINAIVSDAAGNI